MSLSDWVQVGSLTVVAAALVLSLFQNRHLARQTHAAWLQTGAVQVGMQQAAAEGFTASMHELHVTLMKDDPALLRWYLDIRGLPTSTDEANMRTLYMFHKLDAYESIFLKHRAGLLTDEVWVVWCRVLKVDLTIPGYIELWSVVKQFYVDSFVPFLDAQFAEIASSSN